MPDPAADYLRTLNTSDRARAAAWDAVYAPDDTDAQRRLQQLPFSDQVRAELWDIRHGAAVSGGAAPAPARAEDFMGAPQTIAEGAQGPQGSSATRLAKGAAQYLNPMSIASGLYQAGRHPFNTVTAAVGQMGDQWSQARQLAGEGRLLEAGGHAAAGTIPFLGPAAAETGQYIADTGDVAGGVGQGLGLIAPAAVAPVARAGMRATTAVARAVPGMAEAVAGGLERGAAARVTDVMAPKVGANKVRFGNQAAKVAPEVVKDLAADGAPWSRSGLSAHVESKLADAEAGLDAAADGRNAGKPIDTAAILKGLQEKRRALVAEAFQADRKIPVYEGGARVARAGDEFQASGSVTTEDIPTHGRGYRNAEGGFTPEPERRGVPIGQDVEPGPSAARIRAIDRVINEVRQLGPIAPYESLRRIRASWDHVAKTKYAPSVTQDFLTKSGEASGAFDATGVLRDALAAEEPATAAANASYSLYRTANDVLKAAEEVERTRPKVGRAIMARLTGALIGGQQGGTVGAVAGYAGGPILDAAMNAGVTTQLQTAVLMQRLAGVVRSGDLTAMDSVLGKLRAAQIQARRGAVVDKTTNPSERRTPATAPAMSTP